MAATESLPRATFSHDRFAPNMHKSIPILPSSSVLPVTTASDPMEVTPSAPPSMGPPSLSSPVAERHTNPQPSNGDAEHLTNGSSTLAVGAAAAAQQPKVVQTAFIHKLYNMLEDPQIQHLISWSQTQESFVMSPCTEFSKVLSSYFKHTNISSFVRQLNMYGFHKVSDVFHTGQPDSPLWEFRHGNGSFKRGDLVGLREIKRRASRHALIHRDSYPASQKPNIPLQPGGPTEPMQDPVESRLSILEHNYFDIHARLARSEDTSAWLNTKCTALSDGLIRCHQWSQDLATYLMAVFPDSDSQIYKDVTMMQREIARQTDLMRTFDDQPQEPLTSSRQTFFPNIHENGPPLSPRQMPANDRRRPSQPSLLTEPRQSPFRTPHAAHLAISPRRYGSIGTGSNIYSPSSARTMATQPPPPLLPTQHPLASVSSPPTNLSRRHTSADIRLHGWQGGPAVPPSHSPYASGPSSTQWPSSPQRTPLAEDQQIRNALAQYELPRGPTQRGPQNPSPPSATGESGTQSSLTPDAGWQLPGARYPFKSLDAAPTTRRSSMASNVHSLLNPTAIGEEDEDSEGRKRKRIL